MIPFYNLQPIPQAVPLPVVCEALPGTYSNAELNKIGRK